MAAEDFDGLIYVSAAPQHAPLVYDLLSLGFSAQSLIANLS